MAETTEESEQSPGNAPLAGIERALQQVLRNLGDGRDDGIDEAMRRLSSLIESLDADEARHDPRSVSRIQSLFKQAALALATTSRQARGELKRLSAGRKSLRAYRP